MSQKVKDGKENKPDFNGLILTSSSLFWRTLKVKLEETECNEDA